MGGAFFQLVELYLKVVCFKIKKMEKYKSAAEALYAASQDKYASETGFLAIYKSRGKFIYTDKKQRGKPVFETHDFKYEVRLAIDTLEDAERILLPDTEEVYYHEPKEDGTQSPSLTPVEALDRIVKNPYYGIGRQYLGLYRSVNDRYFVHYDPFLKTSGVMVWETFDEKLLYNMYFNNLSTARVLAENPYDPNIRLRLKPYVVDRNVIVNQSGLDGAELGRLWEDGSWSRVIIHGDMMYTNTYYREEFGFAGENPRSAYRFFGAYTLFGKKCKLYVCDHKTACPIGIFYVEDSTEAYYWYGGSDFKVCRDNSVVYTAGLEPEVVAELLKVVSSVGR